jgi:Homeodomain-like domain
VIAADKEAAILRLYHAEKWPLGTIARQVHVHPSTVRRVLAQHGVGAGRAPARPSMIEPFVPFVVETLTAYPGLRASRLYQMVVTVHELGTTPFAPPWDRGSRASAHLLDCLESTPTRYSFLDFGWGARPPLPTTPVSADDLGPGAWRPSAPATC